MKERKNSDLDKLESRLIRSIEIMNHLNESHIEDLSRSQMDSKDTLDNNKTRKSLSAAD